MRGWCAGAAAVMLLPLALAIQPHLPATSPPSTNRTASDASQTAWHGLAPRQVPATRPTAFRKPPKPSPTRASRERVVGLPAVLLRIRFCESRDNYRAENSRSSASGAYQFLDGTWRSTTGLAPPASTYSRSVQDQAALTLYRRSGTRPWAASRSCWS